MAKNKIEEIIEEEDASTAASQEAKAKADTAVVDEIIEEEDSNNPPAPKKEKKETEVKKKAKTASPASIPANKKEKATQSHPKKESKRLVGKTSGVGVQGTWFQIFEDNEKRSLKTKLSDADITKFMNSEFPSKHSEVFKHVSGVRRKYNLGLFGKISKKSIQKEAEEKPKAAVVEKPAKTPKRMIADDKHPAGKKITKKKGKK
jgi:hypothetical protein